jgi:hypothetical protein
MAIELRASLYYCKGLSIALFALVLLIEMTILSSISQIEFDVLFMLTRSLSSDVIGKKLDFPLLYGVNAFTWQLLPGMAKLIFPASRFTRMFASTLCSCGRIATTHAVYQIRQGSCTAHCALLSRNMMYK